MSGRNISKVIDAILPILKEHGMDTKGLEDVKFDVGFAAPEVMHIHWRRASRWLADHLPLPLAEDWTKRISDIWEDRVEVPGAKD